MLGGLTPQQFMRRHWQKAPLLVRQAFPGFRPLLPRAELMALAARDDVQSRLVLRDASRGGPGWQLRHGPFARRALPSLRTPDWTLLVQGVDLHHEAAHALLRQFRFVPDARIDDLMISYATPGGGVGPHFDSYDVFLLQAQGRRRWRIGPLRDTRLQQGVPLKILTHFKPEQELILEPGDVLYLPLRYAHDGIADSSDCMTYSIGFRSPFRHELARELLQRLADAAGAEGDDIYRDANQPAVAHPAAIPSALHTYAREALQQALRDPARLRCAVGEILSEPKPEVWFACNDAPSPKGWRRLWLDRRTRMMYDTNAIYVNGESVALTGADAQCLRVLADQRWLARAMWQSGSGVLKRLIEDWRQAGWVHAEL